MALLKAASICHESNLPEGNKARKGVEVQGAAMWVMGAELVDDCLYTPDDWQDRTLLPTDSDAAELKRCAHLMYIARCFCHG